VASANVDLVRSICAAWEHGDYSRADEWAHSEIEFGIADGPNPSRWTGLAGMAEGWRDFLSAWSAHRAVAEEYREVDRERVLVFLVVTGRGKTSGVELGRTGAHGASLFHLRDGKVIRLVHYFDQERAVADLGLPPEGDS
jgi:ketosteroid isomerase-like protein